MFAIPTLSDLAERARRSFRANLPGTDAWLWPNNIAVSAKVFAGLLYEVFGFAHYIAKQKFALTADSDNLDLHGSEIGLSRKPAAPAFGDIVVTASAAVTIDVGAIFERSDGVQFATTSAAGLVGAGSLTVGVQSITDGATTVTQPGTSLSPTSGVTSFGTVTAAVDTLGLGEGADVEDDESFRARILFRKRNPPHGGSAADYVIWASQYPGVTRVFVERLWQGPGTVRIFPLMDGLYPNGIPPAGQIAAIAAHVSTLQPAAAGVTVAAPTAVPVAITITGLTPDNAGMRSDVTAAIDRAFLTHGRVAGSDSPNSAMPFLATPFSFSRSWIWQAVADTSGEERHAVTVPSSDVALTPGQIATRGAITFV